MWKILLLTYTITLEGVQNEKKTAKGVHELHLFNFDLDEDPTQNNPDEKPTGEKRLVNMFRQPVSKLYAMFVQLVIPIFDSFNTFLQGEEPLIHILYCSLLSKFILLEIISELDDVLSIDLKDSNVFIDFNSIFSWSNDQIVLRGQ